MCRELRRAAGLAVCLLAGLPLAAAAQAAAPPAECDKGTTGPVEVTLKLEAGQCVAAQPIAKVCVERGRTFVWRITNQGCTLDEGKTAVEFTQPEPKTPGAPRWKYEDCTPRKNGMPKGQSTTLVCRVPKAAEPGVYKYGLLGQIKEIDPDIEVRTGR